MTAPQKLSRLFKVLSVESRVRMLEALRHGPLCVGALARVLRITPSAVSQHLRVLRDAGLVAAERQGYFIHYRVDEAALAEAAHAVRELFEAAPLARLSLLAPPEEKSS